MVLKKLRLIVILRMVMNNQTLKDIPMKLHQQQGLV